MTTGVMGLRNHTNNMGWTSIKIDKADALFSKFIRLRDQACVRCGRKGHPDKDGNYIIGLQCSHYWSRRNESTRFDPENCDALCAGCHRLWGGDDRSKYTDYKTKQLGQQGYDLLEIRKNTYHKKDRKMAYLIAKELLATVLPDDSQNAK
jgi:hypothetical protein